MAKTCSLACLVAVLFLAFWAFPASADYYGYKDAKGVWRYTDDVNSVPFSARKGMKVIKSEKTIEKELSNPAPGGENTAAATGTDNAANAAAAKADSAAKAGVADRLEALNKERDALEKEREALAAEREALQKERSQAANRQSQDAVNEKAKAYNERVKAYDARRADYEKKVKEAASARASK